MSTSDEEGKDPFDVIEEAADRLVRRVQWENGNRIGLLWVHALMGIFAGMQILIFGGPGVIEALLGLWSRPVLGTLALVGGLVLASGLVPRPRRIRREACGLVLMGLWDLGFAVALTVVRFKIGNFNPLPLDQPVPQPPVPYAPPYAITVYGGLAALIGVHLWTLRRASKASKAADTGMRRRWNDVR